jgi:S-adenosylmethionine:tRNA ribosyltransferase-isomerase
MEIPDFDYPLPDSLIAERPSLERDGSRLLVIREDGGIEDRRFRDLPEYLREGDMLLLNRAKVMPCRLKGMRPDGRELDILLVENISGNKWEIMSRGGYTGELRISDGLSARIYKGSTAELLYRGDLSNLLRECGEMPLPPYIKRRPDREDMGQYQTVYADAEGSIAAPTAGLHFTDDLLGRIEERGVLVRKLTLHVGKGTFTPIRSSSLDEHRMEPESFEIDPELLEEIKGLGGRLFAVGTTTTRALEGYLGGRYVPEGNSGGPVRGSTDIFIRPGHDFSAVGCLITNFHLPGSTPLVLTAAFCGRERLMKAYEHAVRKSYRFFSYGDAMLIIK